MRAARRECLPYALGLVFVGLAALTDGTYALATARVSRGVRRGARSGRRLARASAATYGVLGVLAIAGAA